jgi:serine protease Do
VTDEFSSLYGVPQGIYVTDVTEGSPADEAGLSKGDVITKFDGSSVTDMETLRSMLAYYAAGETVTITVESAENGEYTERQVELTLGLAADYQ